MEGEPSVIAEDGDHFSRICRTGESMAQDIKAEECTEKWDVTHIPEELQTASSTGTVLLFLPVLMMV